MPIYSTNAPESHNAQIERTGSENALNTFKVDLKKAKKKKIKAQIDKIRINVNGVYITKPSASALKRSLAHAIDSLITGLTALAIVLITLPAELRLTITKGLPDWGELSVYVFDVAYWWIFVWVAYSTYTLSMKGQTTGQKFLNLKVNTYEGDEIPPKRALLRSMAQLSSFVTLGLGLIPCFTGDKLALHDRMSMTQVSSLEEEN